MAEAVPTSDRVPIAELATARLARRLRRDRATRWLLAACAATVLVCIAGIPALLLMRAVGGGADGSALAVLLWGSVKAALVAAAVALPLGIASAAYCARFAGTRVRSTLKPVLELFEAVPGVALGLIAAMTLAPWLARHVVAVALFVVVAPVLLACAGAGWSIVANPRFQRGLRGREWIGSAAVVLLAALLAERLAPLATSALMPPDWQPASPWNSLLIGLALGIAVMPTVFSLAEDALFAVPAALTDGAYALGASR